MRPTRITAIRLLALLADGAAHSNADIETIVKAPRSRIITARRRIRDHGTYLASSEYGWRQTTDPVLIEAHWRSRIRNHYSELSRLARSMHDAMVAAPNDLAVQRRAAEAQATAMQLGCQLGLTPLQIAADLTPMAGPV